MKAKAAVCKLVLPVILCVSCSSLFAYGAEVDSASSLEPATKELSAAQDGLNTDSTDSAALDSEPTSATASESASASAETNTAADASAPGDTQDKSQTETPKDSVIVGDPDREVSEAKADDTQDVEDKTPKIVEIGVSGTFNKNAKGLDYFKDIRIDLVGDNLTDDHFLTPEGLHWSDKTTVELIAGKALGNFDFSEYNVDKTKASGLAYRTNVGDSGRLTYVGRTKSGIDLDLIWTVSGSDQEEWANYSGFNTGGIKGLTFVSEGTFVGATGNSIAVIYNNASNLGLNYRIVAHGTTTDMPVILSFISSDIDSAQGVETNLANILELIPDNNNLTKKDGIIYDKTPGVVNVNGSKDLPHGGYLGASFLSSFYYNFYSPAPARISNSYAYPTAVRYDIFGSSLQARLEAKFKRHMSVSYVDTYGKELKPLVSYEGLNTETYKFTAQAFPKHTLVDMKLDTIDANYPKISFIYAPLHSITIRHIDESGNTIDADQTVEVVDRDSFEFMPADIAGYKTPAKVSLTALKDEIVTLRYTKIEAKAPVSNVSTGATIKKSAYTYTYIPKTNTVYIAPKPVVKTTSKIAGSTRQETNVLKKHVFSGKLKPFIIPEPTYDAFSENLGIPFVDGLNLKRYIGSVDGQYSNPEKADEALLSSLGYKTYYDNKLQKLLINFNKRTSIEANGDIDYILQSLHGNKGKIDVPHMAVSLRSVRENGMLSKLVRMAASYPTYPFKTLNYNDIFFLHNSLYGDSVTMMGEKDYITDVDAYILQNNPNIPGITFGQKFVFYYSIPNLDHRRQELYKETLQLKLKSSGNSNYLESKNWELAAATAGGIALVILGIRQRRQAKKEGTLSKDDEKFRKKWLKSIGKKKINKNIISIDVFNSSSKLTSPSPNILRNRRVVKSKPTAKRPVKRVQKIQTNSSRAKRTISKIVERRIPKYVTKIIAKKPATKPSLTRKPVTRKPVTRKPIARKSISRGLTSKVRRTSAMKRINSRIRRV